MNEEKVVPLDIVQMLEEVIKPLGFCIKSFGFDNQGITLQLDSMIDYPHEQYIGASSVEKLKFK